MELHPIFVEALGYYELYRRYGFQPDDIDVFVTGDAISSRTMFSVNKPVVVIRGVMGGRPFVTSIAASPWPQQEFFPLWEQAAQYWNTCGPDEALRIVKSSQGVQTDG